MKENQNRDYFEEMICIAAADARTFMHHSRAVDPHSFFWDPDPAVFLNADPDPEGKINADPNPA